MATGRGPPATDVTSTEPVTTTDDACEGCIPDRYCTTFESTPGTWVAATPAELDMGI